MQTSEPSVDVAAWTRCRRGRAGKVGPNPNGPSSSSQPSACQAWPCCPSSSLSGFKMRILGLIIAEWQQGQCLRLQPVAGLGSPIVSCWPATVFRTLKILASAYELHTCAKYRHYAKAYPQHSFISYDHPSEMRLPLVLFNG